MADINKVIVFGLGEEEYALPIEHVLSIEKLESITPIPHLPPYVRGILKVRDELVPILDGEKILYDRLLSIDDTVRVIIIMTEELSVGLLVREAKEIIEIPAENLKQVGLVAYDKTSFFTAVANLKDRLITLITPEKFIQSLDGIREIQEFMKNHGKQEK